MQNGCLLAVPQCNYRKMIDNMTQKSHNRGEKCSLKASFSRLQSYWQMYYHSKQLSVLYAVVSTRFVHQSVKSKDIM